jgi:hypothetical protein
MTPKFIKSSLQLESPIIVTDGESFIVDYTSSIYPFVINVNGYTLKKSNQVATNIDTIELPPFSFFHFPAINKIKCRLY